MRHDAFPPLVHSTQKVLEIFGVNLNTFVLNFLGVMGAHETAESDCWVAGGISFADVGTASNLFPLLFALVPLRSVNQCIAWV